MQAGGNMCIGGYVAMRPLSKKRWTRVELTHPIHKRNRTEVELLEGPAL